VSEAAIGARSTDLALAATLLKRVSTDLGMVIDRTIALGEPSVERAHQKPPARGGIHISFRLAFASGARSLHGCLLVPLADAISVASYMMMVADDGVSARRNDAALDKTTKDAILEVGNFIGGAADAALRDTEFRHYSARADGCQGVKDGDLPVFRFVPGSELVVARAKLQVHQFPASELLLMLPVLELAQARAA
jgi:hypothetical protein